MDETLVEMSVLLAAVDNALRNGNYMNGANLAFDELCERLGHNRDELEFNPYWLAGPVRSETAPREHHERTAEVAHKLSEEEAG